MDIAISALLIIVGLVNGVPVVGLISSRQVQRQYGLNELDANLAILMRHRAVMLGIVGGLLIASAFIPAWRSVAMIAGFINMIAYVAIAYATGGFNEQVKRVAIVDLVAIVLLGAALALHIAGMS
jgi:hypothetical protein